MAYIGGHRRSVYGYTTSQVSDAEKSIQVKSGTEGRQRRMRTLHKSMCMFPDYQKSTFTAGCLARSKRSSALNCFLSLATYCCDVSQGRDVSATRQGFSVRRL